jgi:hypothetical protein
MSNILTNFIFIGIKWDLIEMFDIFNYSKHSIHSVGRHTITQMEDNDNSSWETSKTKQMENAIDLKIFYCHYFDLFLYG